LASLFAEEKTGLEFGKRIVALPIGFLTGNVGIAIAELFKGCFVGFTDGA